MRPTITHGFQRGVCPAYRHPDWKIPNCARDSAHQNPLRAQSRETVSHIYFGNLAQIRSKGRAEPEDAKPGSLQRAERMSMIRPSIHRRFLKASSCFRDRPKIPFRMHDMFLPGVETAEDFGQGTGGEVGPGRTK